MYKDLFLRVWDTNFVISKSLYLIFICKKVSDSARLQQCPHAFPHTALYMMPESPHILNHLTLFVTFHLLILLSFHLSQCHTPLLLMAGLTDSAETHDVNSEWLRYFVLSKWILNYRPLEDLGTLHNRGWKNIFRTHKHTLACISCWNLCEEMCQASVRVVRLDLSPRVTLMCRRDDHRLGSG